MIAKLERFSGHYDEFGLAQLFPVWTRSFAFNIETFVPSLPRNSGLPFIVTNRPTTTTTTTGLNLPLTYSFLDFFQHLLSAN